MVCVCLCVCNYYFLTKYLYNFELNITFISSQLLRDQFDYKPILTKKQFIQSGFAEWKIQIVCDVLNCVMKKHKELIDSDKVI